MNHEAKMKRINALIAQLKDEGDKLETKYTEKDCPMAKLGTTAHYLNAQLIDGLGNWKWACPFCGTEFQS